MILLRFGANPNPIDGGSCLILSILDKLNECETDGYPYQVVSCLEMLMRATGFFELPYKVQM
jgi:ankyrin repeat/SOCS box protein 17